MIESIEVCVAQYGYVAIFVLLMLGIVGLPVPDETLLTFTGYLVYRGNMHVIPACISAFLGTVCGITVSYMVGRTGGFYLLKKYGPRIRITAEKVARVDRWFEHAGRWSLTLCYFVPGVRHLIALVAGASKMKLSVFAPFAYSGGLVWSIGFIAAGYYLGKDWHILSEPTHRILTILSIAAIVIMAAYLLHRKGNKAPAA